MSTLDDCRDALKAATVDADDALAICEKIYGASNGLNTGYLLMSGFLVFVMQIGFAMLCAGSVRSKNTMSILLKNVLDACIGGIMWYLIGYGLAFGPSLSTAYNDNNSLFLSGGKARDKAQLARSEFVGHSWFAVHRVDTVGEPFGYASWFFQFAFAATTATIVSGAIAERASFAAYVGYATLLTGWVYPVIVHWLWSAEGWLSPWNNWATNSPGRGGSTIGPGAIDFAGSGVVHLTGGTAALVAAFFVGPRIGRFDASGKPNPMPGHSATLVTLGTFLLWFGWYGFNPGSTLAINTAASAQITARVALTTTLGAASGGVSALAWYYMFTNTLDLINVCNGVLCGLVAITAGCATVRPWSALIAGLVAAPVFYGASALVKKLRIDDVVDAFAMHGANGIWALIFTGFLSAPELVEQVYGFVKTDRWYGCFYHGGNGELLGAQLIEIVVIMAWTGFWIGAYFAVLKLLGKARVSESEEQVGLDASKHGGTAYNMGGGGGGKDYLQQDRPMI